MSEQVVVDFLISLNFEGCLHLSLPRTGRASSCGTRGGTSDFAERSRCTNIFAKGQTFNNFILQSTALFLKYLQMFTYNEF
jgi:hypothetical protein